MKLFATLTVFGMMLIYSGCIHEQFMEQTGKVLVELGKNKLNADEGGVSTSDLLMGVGLILGGGALTGGTGWVISKNGKAARPSRRTDYVPPPGGT